MNIVYRFFCIISLLFFLSQTAICSSINLFLKPAPQSIQQQVRQTMINQGLIYAKIERLHTKSTSQVGKKLLKNGFKKFLPQVSGFVALYGGYVDYSDKDGNIVFPLLHKEKKVYLVITPKIDLNFIHKNTISHKNFVQDVPAKQYLFRRLEDADKTVYWEIKESVIPAHKRINPLSIVILTKPKNIVVPTGDFMSAENPNLVLPNLYIVGNFDNVKSLLEFLDIRRFFEQIERKDEKVTETVTQKLIINN